MQQNIVDRNAAGEENSMTIRIGIMGYGNLGRGVECAVRQSPDMELAAVFTRRNPDDIEILTENVKVYSADDAEKFSPVAGASPADAIDVLILCGGSAADLPLQTPKYASLFNVVDSFDTHARIPEHFANVDAASKGASTAAIISAGWDPGLFSVNRLYSESILPTGATYTFWGKGVSQGHSDAVRRIEGVLDARQYTIPVEAALEAVRSGGEPELSTRQKHTREVFVVAEENADKEKITEEIVTMKNYFDEYDTSVHFIDAAEMARDHSGIPHGGFVIRSGRTGWDEGNNHVIEYKLTLDSNPEFTSSVLAASARAAWKLSCEGLYGAKTIFDIAPAYLSPKSGEELRKTML